MRTQKRYVYEHVGTVKLLHDKYYGDFFQLVEIRATVLKYMPPHSLQRWDEGALLQVVSGGSKLNIRKQSLPLSKYGMSCQMQS